MPELNIYLYEPEKVEAGTGALADLSLAVKDNISVANWPLTAGSKILEGYVAPYDATVIKRLKKAGAKLTGKVNLDEFAMGSSTENSAYGATKNPWNPDYVPGGSSGGSAAAVAAGLVEASLGSDTGGSIRQPAAFCGITGLKPTYGSVSRYGLVALASSLDVIGPLARDAATVERVFEVIAGQDEHDQTTIDFTYQSETPDLGKLRIGLPKELWGLEIDPEVKQATEAFVKFFTDKGATCHEVSLPSLPLALPAYYIILPAEASANLARYDGIRYQASRDGENLLARYLNSRAHFGPEVKRRILIGTFTLSVGHFDAYYQQASRVRDKITREHEQVFGVGDQAVDVLISPTTPTLPFKFGERQDPVAMYQSDLMTVGANLAGVPAVSVPIGFSASGLPIGGQLTAAKTRDGLLLALAKAYQAETGHHTRQPQGANHG